MRLLIDELEGPFYIDIVLSPDEVERMKDGEMVDAFYAIGLKRFYIGTRMDREYFHEKENDWSEEDWQGFD